MPQGLLPRRVGFAKCAACKTRLALRVCSHRHAVCGVQSLSLKAREKLSSKSSATITIPTAGDQPNVEIQLTRNTLDKLAGELLRKMRLPMEQVRRRRAYRTVYVRLQPFNNTTERAAVGRGSGGGVLLVQCAFQCGVDLAAQGDMASRKGSSGRRGIAMRRRGRYLDEILMVGGATRMPAVRRFVENMTVHSPYVPLPSFSPPPVVSSRILAVVRLEGVV